MNELPTYLEGIRECPFACGWHSTRRMHHSLFHSVERKLPAFIERCQGDLVLHLIEAPGATRAAELVEANWAEA